MSFTSPTSSLSTSLSSSSSSTKSSTTGTNGIETDIVPINKPVGKKPKQKSPTATFLGGDAEPGEASGNFGGKTLLGM